MVLDSLSNFSNRFLELFGQTFPPLCWNCRRWLSTEQSRHTAYPFLCNDCLVYMPWTNPDFSCQRCGHYTKKPHQLICSFCKEVRFHFQRAYSAFHYESIIQQWIIQLKFGRNEHLACMLGKLLALGIHESFHDQEFDAILPIPLHRRRLRQRGFNQALLLAHYAFPTHSIQKSWLQRHRMTVPQTGLTALERASNVKEAFQVSPEVEGKKILVVDDVMTTGATFNAVAKTLKDSGAESVYVVALARRMRMTDL